MASIGDDEEDGAEADAEAPAVAARSAFPLVAAAASAVLPLASDMSAWVSIGEWVGAELSGQFSAGTAQHSDSDSGVGDTGGALSRTSSGGWGREKKKKKKNTKKKQRAD